MARLRRPFGRKCREDGITFDSKLELAIYQRLKPFFSDIQVHYPLTLGGPNTFFSLELEALVKPLKWKVDFYIPSIETVIEVKGIWELVDRYRLIAALELLETNTLGIHKDRNGKYARVKKIRVIQANDPPKCWFNQHSQTYRDWFLPVQALKNIKDKDALLKALNL